MMNDIRDIKRTIDQDIVKKIFSNKTNAIAFLELYNYDKKVLTNNHLVSCLVKL